jgi:hypothetical protein
MEVRILKGLHAIWEHDGTRNGERRDRKAQRNDRLGALLSNNILPHDYDPVKEKLKNVYNGKGIKDLGARGRCTA